MLTQNQLEILKDMFDLYDDEWLLTHFSIKHTGHRNFIIEVENGNFQDCDELFPGEYSKKIRYKMTIVLAFKTVAKIDEMIRADQGAAFRQLLGKLIPDAKDAYEGQKDEFRSHLGASMIGRECPRELWYNFHWAKPPSFEGRMLRLFNRGHLEEPRLVAMLMMIGCEVWSQDADGNQFRISGVGGHFGSAIDGVLNNCPDVPDEPILGEFKTHNDKSFKKLVADGVKKAKFEHYVQMQIYMGEYQLRYALYLAVNKNDDMLHGEIVEFDQPIYDTYMARADKIILSTTIPTRISDNSSFWKCMYCDFREICHLSGTPSVNCRTCAGSVPTEDGKYHCVKFSVVLDKKMQLTGCQEYDRKMEFMG